MILVRRSYPNPRDLVTLDSKIEINMSLSEGLRESNVFSSEDDRNFIGGFSGAGSNPYCVFEIGVSEGWKRDAPDQGLRDFIAMCESGDGGFALTDFNLIIAGHDDAVYKLVRQELGFIRSHHGVHLCLPDRILNKVNDSPMALKMSTYVGELSREADKMKVTRGYLDGLLSRIDSDISNGRNQLVPCNLASKSAKWLYLYIALNHPEVGVTPSTLFFNYVESEVAYPQNRLTLFERIKFLRELPRTFGYVDIYNKFYGFISPLALVYPDIEFVYDPSTGKPLRGYENIANEPPEGYDPSNLLWKTCVYNDFDLCDTASLFDASASDGSMSGLQLSLNQRLASNTELMSCARTLQNKLSVSVTTEDIAKDFVFCDIFARIAECADVNLAYPTWHNVVCARHKATGKPVYIYSPGVSGVKCQMLSNVFGALRGSVDGNNIKGFDIPESYFKYFCDYTFARASYDCDNDEMQFSNKITKTAEALAVRGVNTQCNPAVPLKERILCDINGRMSSNLTYYQRCLRCSDPLLSVQSRADSEQHFAGLDGVNGFTELSIMRDQLQQGSLSINSFGSIRIDRKSAMITMKAWRGTNDSRFAGSESDA